MIAWSFRALALSLSVLVGVPAPVKAASLLTNLDLLVATVEDAVDETFTQMPALGAARLGSVAVVAEAPHPANWVAEYVLAERLLARGLTVSADTASTSGVRLSYRLVDLRVKGRSGLRGGSVERQARASMVFRLSQGDSVSWQHESTASLSDRVPRHRLDLVTNASYPFTKAEIEERSIGRFVEPFIVSTVLGGLIYLFFANR